MPRGELRTLLSALEEDQRVLAEGAPLAYHPPAWSAALAGLTKMFGALPTEVSALFRFHDGQDGQRFAPHDRLHPGEDVALLRVSDIRGLGKTACRGSIARRVTREMCR